MKRGKLGKSEHQKEKSTKFERKLAKDLGGQAVPGSGAFMSHKGDVKTDMFLLDSKQTAVKGGKGIYISGTMLTKITRESNQENRYPGIVATIEEAPFGVAKSWALIPLHVFKSILEELEELKNEKKS